MIISRDNILGSSWHVEASTTCEWSSQPLLSSIWQPRSSRSERYRPVNGHGPLTKSESSKSNTSMIIDRLLLLSDKDFN